MTTRKLRLTVSLEYDADPRLYRADGTVDEPTSLEMAEIDEREMADDLELVSFVMSQHADVVRITVDPV